MISLAPTQSLRTRLLVPLLIVVSLVAVGISVISYTYGGRIADRELQDKFAAISTTLSDAAFPLTPTVLETLSQLTGAELVTWNERGEMLHSTTAIPPASVAALSQLSATRTTTAMTEIPGNFHIGSFRRLKVESRDPTRTIAVLFQSDWLDKQQRRAAVLPLVTGLSSAVLIALSLWFAIERWIRRIQSIQVDVQRIAAGDFAQPVHAVGNDELGQLSSDVERMRVELVSLWKAIHQQERQRLIHQMAAALAHQLRNCLTGARMAVELHQRDCANVTNDPSLAVAIAELQRTEDYVWQILSVASGKESSLESGSVQSCLDSVRASLQTIAKHRHVGLNWSIESSASRCDVANIKSLGQALQNLVVNAIQAGGDQIIVDASLDAAQQRLRLQVRDNGPGPAPAPDVDYFDPFVTTKPEGLGLGLALVRRVAHELNGTASWKRVDGWTEFTLEVSVLALTDSREHESQHGTHS